MKALAPQRDGELHSDRSLVLAVLNYQPVFSLLGEGCHPSRTTSGWQKRKFYGIFEGVSESRILGKKKMFRGSNFSPLRDSFSISISCWTLAWNKTQLFLFQKFSVLSQQYLTRVLISCCSGWGGLCMGASVLTKHAINFSKLNWTRTFLPSQYTLVQLFVAGGVIVYRMLFLCSGFCAGE